MTRSTENVTHTEVKNTISVSGKKDGKTYTDSCTWTLTSPQARVAGVGAPSVFSMKQVHEKSVADELLV